MKKEKLSFVQVLLKKHRDKNHGHYHAIMDAVDDKYVSVGTTSKPTKGAKSKSPNYKCEQDILGNGQTTYLRRQATVDKKSNYFDGRSGKMSSKDYERARIYAERAKQKYLSRKKKK